MFFAALLLLGAVFNLVQSVPVEVQNIPTQHCLSSLQLNAEVVSVFREYYDVNCPYGATTSVLCEFAFETKQQVSVEKENVSGQNSVRAKREIPLFPSGDSVYLNVYNLLVSHPLVRALKCIEPEFDSDALYQTSISYRGDEYYYGIDGVVRVPDGKSSFGSVRERMILGNLNLTRHEMQQHIDTLVELGDFTAEYYNLFTFNCNSFTDEFSLVFFDSPIDPSYQQTFTKLANSPLGSWIKWYQSKLKFE